MLHLGRTPLASRALTLSYVHAATWLSHTAHDSHLILIYILQAVALVFDHVLVEMQQSSSSMIAEPASPSGASQPGSAKGPETPTARGHGTTNAALKLLDDLCMMATGNMRWYLWFCLMGSLPRGNNGCVSGGYLEAGGVGGGGVGGGIPVLAVPIVLTLLHRMQ